MLGGMGMVRLGIARSLWIYGILQMISTLSFLVLANAGSDVRVLTIVVIFENVCTGMAASALVGFISSLCNKKFTATQYALLSSLTAVPRVILGSSTGYIAKHLGWHGYYIFCTLLHLPGLLLLLRQRSWSKPADASAPNSGSAK